MNNIELSNKEFNNRIGRYASRISGKPTVNKVLEMMRVVYKGNDLPSVEYVKAYLKWYNS